MPAIRGYIAHTFEQEAPDTDSGTVIGSQDVRIHYRYTPGRAATMYANNGDPGHPADDAEVEFSHVEIERPGHTPRWQRVELDDDTDGHVAAMGELWLMANDDSVAQQETERALAEADIRSGE